MTASPAPPGQPARRKVPYGEWPSPISADQLSRAPATPAFPEVAGGSVWWQQGLPAEGGRVTVMRSSGGQAQPVLPAPWNARTRVHEYGGQSYLPVPADGGGHRVLFAHFADQRLYLAGTSGAADPVPLTPDPAGEALTPGALRYADFSLSPDGSEVWCVRERHEQGRVTRTIAAVPLDGSAADDPGAVTVLAGGADFFAYPAASPDGRWLAWISWNHPHMPWDGTELRVAPLDGGRPGKPRLLMGGPHESVLAPAWRDGNSLYAATDWPGWWNIYQVGLAGEPPMALYPAEQEFAGPLWQLGGRPFVVLADGRLAVTHGAGPARLGLLDPESLELTGAGTQFAEYALGGVAELATEGTTLAAVAAGPASRPAVVALDLATSRLQVLGTDEGGLPPKAYLPAARPVTFEGPYGQAVHAVVYPPSHPDLSAPDGELAPYVVWVHGGPTSRAVPVLDLAKAYFTSRGIGIIDVNYSGSSGYGRRYRERLQGEWGVADVQDAIAAARWAVASAGADPARLAIRGGSAGGWTTLAAVTTGLARGRVFSAAVSRYGVADLRGLAEGTHDFESRYLDGLVGPLPAADHLYAQRSPLGHVRDETCPILLLQGLDDPVVPPAQSQSIAADLAAHGIPHAYITFEGESHGFRRAETVAAAYEAELSFYGQILGFEPPGIPAVAITRPGQD